jgi:small subunit ribosomal protein S21
MEDSEFGPGLSVVVKNNDVNKALRKLKKKIQNEGLFQDLRKRECFEKPSILKKRSKAMAVKRWQKKAKELRDDGLMP